MLTLHPGGLFSRTVIVRSNGHDLATIRDKAMREGAHIRIEGVEYELRRSGIMSGDYLLESAGRVLATGRKPSFFSRRMQADIGGWVYDLVPRANFTSKFVVQYNGQVVGSIGPKPVIRSFPADLPPDMPTVYQVFMIGLVTLMWNRSED